MPWFLNHLCDDQEFIVKKNSYLAIAIAGTAMFAAMTALAQAAVTDPSAAVPPVAYQSVFNESPTGVEIKSVDWKKANAEVGQFKRGHVDILKWEESQLKDKPASRPAPKSDAAPKNAAPSPAPAGPTPHKH
jgi:hypothetical protein